MQVLSRYLLLVKDAKAHDQPIYCCAWTLANLTGDKTAAPKDIIVTSGLHPNIKVWDWQDNMLKPKRELRGHTSTVSSLSFNPNGQILVSTSMDFTLIVWHMVTGRCIYRIPAPTAWRAAFAPDGVHVVAGCHDDDITVYNIAKGSVNRVYDTRVRFSVCVAWSADNKFIATGTLIGTVCVLDAAHGKVIHTFNDHKGLVKNIDFSPNSKLLVTASNDCSFKLYDVVAGTLLHSFYHTSQGTSVSFAPDGKRIALGTSDGEVIIALTDGLHLLKKFKEHTDFVWEVQFSPKGDMVLSSSSDKTINVYECPDVPKSKK